MNNRDLEKIEWLSKQKSILIRSLKKSENRKKHNRMLIEGLKCCEELLASEINIDCFVIDIESNIIKETAIFDIIITNKYPIYKTSTSIFSTLCDAKTPQGILAIAKPNQRPILKNTSFIAIDNLNDPGNVGTIIRTAEWFGIKQILSVGNCADAFSPKVIRSSMGSIFRINVINVKNGDLDFFATNFDKIPIYIASNYGGIDINDINPYHPFGLIVGNESFGVSNFLTKLPNKICFKIDGAGETESLNVAIATGISLFYLTRKEQ